ncbi:MAG: hypothetical protein M1568_02330 [Acidobacteria bacterium]|jgi:hypothetical protein|nr:hypothetical protein [Acidobacteriota bacterium]
MTLLDAPPFDARRAKLIRGISIFAVVLVCATFFGTILYTLDFPWQLWNWPSDHRVNVFLSEIEAGHMKKAYAEWNNDPNWEQHPDRYKLYDFNSFMRDWGPQSDYGVIKSHKIIVAKRVGNGVIMGVDINGGSTPIFLRVDDASKEIGFSPIELYVGP